MVEPPFEQHMPECPEQGGTKCKGEPEHGRNILGVTDVLQIQLTFFIQRCRKCASDRFGFSEEGMYRI
jgi:hypothetical protein